MKVIAFCDYMTQLLIIINAKAIMKALGQMSIIIIKCFTLGKTLSNINCTWVYKKRIQ